jgi:hypothetical protein
MSWRSVRAIAAIPAMLIAALMGPVASGEDAPGGATPDCEVRALVILHHLEGRPVGPEEVAEHLPRPEPGWGRSLLDLQDAAGALGLTLRGVSLSEPIRLDRPALVRLREGDHDHAVVVRPVGWTGRLVQVIDPTSGPRVMDASLLPALAGWNGRALIPSRARWGGRMAGGMVLAGAGLAVVGLRTRPGAKRKRGDSGLPSSGRRG